MKRKRAKWTEKFKRLGNTRFRTVEKIRSEDGTIYKRVVRDRATGEEMVTKHGKTLSLT